MAELILLAGVSYCLIDYYAQKHRLENSTAGAAGIGIPDMTRTNYGVNDRFAPNDMAIQQVSRAVFDSDGGALSSKEYNAEYRRTRRERQRANKQDFNDVYFRYSGVRKQPTIRATYIGTPKEFIQFGEIQNPYPESKGIVNLAQPYYSNVQYMTVR